MDLQELVYIFNIEGSSVVWIGAGDMPQEGNQQFAVSGTIYSNINT